MSKKISAYTFPVWFVQSASLLAEVVAVTHRCSGGSRKITDIFKSVSLSVKKCVFCYTSHVFITYKVNNRSHGTPPNQFSSSRVLNDYLMGSERATTPDLTDTGWFSLQPLFS